MSREKEEEVLRKMIYIPRLDSKEISKNFKAGEEGDVKLERR